RSNPALTRNVPLNLIRLELPAQVWRNSRFTFNCRVRSASSAVGVASSTIVRLLTVIRGCKWAMSMNAERKSLPRRSKSSVLWPIVRAGQLSSRQKMKTPAAMTINTTNVNAAGQENRPDVSEFRIWMFDVEYWAFSSNHPKKVPPPTPDGREG